MQILLVIQIQQSQSGDSTAPVPVVVAVATALKTSTSAIQIHAVTTSRTGLAGFCQTARAENRGSMRQFCWRITNVSVQLVSKASVVLTTLTNAVRHHVGTVVHVSTRTATSRLLPSTHTAVPVLPVGRVHDVKLTSMTVSVGPVCTAESALITSFSTIALARAGGLVKCANFRGARAARMAMRLPVGIQTTPYVVTPAQTCSNASVRQATHQPQTFLAQTLMLHHLLQAVILNVLTLMSA